MTGLAKALSRMASAYDIDLDDDLYETWRETLVGVPVQSVESAMSSWIRDNHFKPKPSEIRRHALEIASGKSNSQPEPEHWQKNTFKCLQCEDMGLVTAWHPDTVKSVQARDEKPKLRTCVYRCNCEKGQQHPLGNPPKRSDGYQRESLPVVDGRVCIKLKGTFEKALKAILTWQPEAKGMPNHVESFDQWNNEVTA